MTAEILIMNREAVALAADSAVVLGFESSHKVFHSAKKVFALSKYQPVGIMIFGNVRFMGVPWETIIKTYRDQLDNTEFDKLIDYAKDFLNYLDNNTRLFPEETQLNYGRRKIFYYLSNIKNEIQTQVKNQIENQGSIDYYKITKIISETIASHYSLWSECKKLDIFLKSRYEKNIKIKFNEIIDSTLKVVFQKLPLNHDHIRQLKAIALSLFIKTNEKYTKLLAKSLTGVVIAGFGRNDVFPSSRSYLLESVSCDKLKYTLYSEGDITHEKSVCVEPFAEREMVDVFLLGGVGYFVRYHAPEFNTILEHAIERESDIGLKNEQKKKIMKLVPDSFDHISLESNASLNQIKNMISEIPKQELAELAESLINITTLKQRFMVKDETVGGPIDVAIITKGDGFIWIKRKHYFEAKLNPHFVKKCFGDKYEQGKITYGNSG